MPPQSFIGSILADKQKAILHELTDYAALRRIIKDNTLAAAQRRFPLENERYALAVKDLKWSDADTSIKAQKDAMMQGYTLSDKLKGSWVLTDKATGSVVSETGAKTIMNVPAMTQRGTFIKNGNEMTLSHVMRLNPGVYSRKTADGRYEAMFNVEQGTGAGFRVYMDPGTGVFKLKKGGVKCLFPAFVQSILL